MSPEPRPDVWGRQQKEEKESDRRSPLPRAPSRPPLTSAGPEPGLPANGERRRQGGVRRAPRPQHGEAPSQGHLALEDTPPDHLQRNSPERKSEGASANPAKVRTGSKYLGVTAIFGIFDGPLEGVPTIQP